MMIPLDSGQVLFLKGRDEFDPVELTRVLDPLGFEPFITTRAELAEAEIKRVLLEFRGHNTKPGSSGDTIPNPASIQYCVPGMPRLVLLGL